MCQQLAVAQVGWGWGQNAVLFVCIRRKGLSLMRNELGHRRKGQIFEDRDRRRP
jgi:hypothetical protein